MVSHLWHYLHFSEFMHFLRFLESFFMKCFSKYLVHLFLILFLSIFHLDKITLLRDELLTKLGSGHTSQSRFSLLFCTHSTFSPSTAIDRKDLKKFKMISPSSWCGRCSTRGATSGALLYTMWQILNLTLFVLRLKGPSFCFYHETQC